MARKHRSKGTGTIFKRTPRGPWIASWYDASGKRRERSCRCTDRAAAERILTKHVADAALRREGVVNAATDRYSIEGRKPLTEHVEAYLTHCRNAEQSGLHVELKEMHLGRVVEGTSATRVGELTADALERHLAALKVKGMSPRSLNFAR